MRVKKMNICRQGQCKIQHSIKFKVVFRAIQQEAKMLLQGLLPAPCALVKVPEDVRI